MIMQKQTDFDPAVSGDLNIRVHGPGHRSWASANTPDIEKYILFE